MKIENQCPKRSHKLDGIGVGRNRTFPFLPIPFTTPSLMIQWKVGCQSRPKQKRKKQPIKRPGIEHCHCLFFRFCLRLRQCSFHLIVSDGVILSRISVLLRTTSVWFFTRWYRSTLLITTPTATPSLVKTSLNCCSEREHDLISSPVSTFSARSA